SPPGSRGYRNQSACSWAKSNSACPKPNQPKAVQRVCRKIQCDAAGTCPPQSCSSIPPERCEKGSAAEWKDPGGDDRPLPKSPRAQRHEPPGSAHCDPPGSTAVPLS